VWFVWSGLFLLLQPNLCFSADTVKSQLALDLNLPYHVLDLTPADDHDDRQPAAGNFLIQPDRDGLISDTGYFFLYQVAFISILYIAPESISNWSDETKKKDRIKSWQENIREVVRDEDKWTVNYIGHPYFGAAYYIRARERGYQRGKAFWYAVALSTAYEFGIEAMFENPSQQDLIVTPVLGSALGYYFETVRDDIRRSEARTGKLTGYDRFLLNVTDPLNYLNQYADKWFKGDVEVNFMPYFTLPSTPRHSDTSRSGTFGLLLNIQW
jgi:hypothetical protein